MPDDASDLARRLARDPEAVCRYYLSRGRRHGRYWLVGDVENAPGRSLFVRLTGPTSGKSAAGKWTDAATGAYGDLLDLIAANRHLASLRDVLDEARIFLRLPRPEPPRHEHHAPAPQSSPEAARRLWAMSKPIGSTVAATYLHGRGLTDLRNCGALRFHPRCYYRDEAELPGDRAHYAWPALIASVGDGDGQLTGLSRTWLALDGHDKAPVATPRRAMGRLLGHGIRFGAAEDVMAAGEGIETMLSLRQVLPGLPMVAATSANHLAAVDLPAGLRGSISPATTIPPGTPRHRPWAAGRQRSALRRLSWHRCWATSTTTCAGLDEASSWPACGCNSLRKTSPASWS